MPVRPSSPDIGDQPILFVDVTDAQSPSMPVNPTDGRVLVMKPNGTVTAHPFASMVVAPGGRTGRVEFLYPTILDQSGSWRVRWEFTLGVVAAAEFWFDVQKRTVPAPF